MIPEFAAVTDSATEQYMPSGIRGDETAIHNYNFRFSCWLKNNTALFGKTQKKLVTLLSGLVTFISPAPTWEHLGKSLRGNGFEEGLVSSETCVGESIEQGMVVVHRSRDVWIHKRFLEALKRLSL